MLKKTRSPGKIVVISDTHFGDKSQLLDDPHLVGRFMGVLEGLGQVDELILLGDVIDLWMSTLVPALRSAKLFVESLSRLGNVRKFLYIPGNHDHQVFMNAFRMELDLRIMQGNLGQPAFLPARSYGDSILSGIAHPKSRAHFPLVYPYVIRTVNGRDVVLTHGHHLDFYATRDGDPEKKFWLGRQIMKRKKNKATLHDIEMANIVFCGAMSVWPWVPELVGDGVRYYRLFNFFDRLFRSDRMYESPLRDSLIKESYDEIDTLLPELEGIDPACFVYGHTHRPGMGVLPGSGTVVVNCGSWARLEDAQVPSRTWVEIDGDVRLMRLGAYGPEVVASETLPAAEIARIS